MTSRRASASPTPRFVAAIVVAAVLAAAALITLSAGPASAASAPVGLHVSGNHLLDSAGNTVVLRGVDRSGSEYACIQGFGFFDGPSDAASIAAMASWHIDAVRVPLNEDCWLGINNSPAAYSGSAYQAAIEGYVSRLHAAGLDAILDLHWTAAGTNQSTGQQDMPDADHAGAFWASVATAFNSDSATVFDLFNEPHDVSWTCWRDGGDCGIGYQVAGMQSLVNAVRSTGATNPIMVGGLAYANDLSQWLAYRPADPTGNLMASWHSYNFNACNTTSCWDSQIAPVSAAVPLVAGEVGENDCAHGYLDAVLPWLDSHGGGYLGWGWDTFGCGSFPALISSYDGTPTAFGVGLRDHLTALSGGNPSPSPTPTTTSPSPTPTGGAGTLAVSTSTNTSSAPYFWEEDLTLTPSASATKLAVTITVAGTAGITNHGYYDTAATGVLGQKEKTGSGSLVYRTTLNIGQTLAAGTILVAAQFNGTGMAHVTAGDTYKVTATVGGRKVTASGHF